MSPASRTSIGLGPSALAVLSALLLAAGPASAEPDRYQAGLSGDARLGDDISIWGGVRGDVCMDLGPLCVGGSLRLAADIRAKGAGSDLGTSRTVLDALLIADLPIALGSIRLVPGVGAGTTVLYARRRGFWGSENDSSLRPQLWLHTALDVPLAEATAFRANIGYAHSAFAESELGNPSDERAALGGMPAHMLVVGFGVQWHWH